MVEYEEREDNLPKWARDKIKDLRNRLFDTTQHLKEERQQVGVTVKDPHVGVGTDLLNGQSAKLYPADTRVRFNLKGGKMRRGVHIYARENTLYINGDYPLYVKPQASNAVQVKLEDGF